MKNGFVPFHIKYGNSNKLIWVNSKVFPADEPFFEENIIKNLDRLSKNFLETDLTYLGNFEPPSQFLNPNGFIFHMSRCGSTLLANLLRRQRETIVLSEPGIFNEIFSLGDELPVDPVSLMFHNAVRYFGQSGKRDKNYVIKLSCQSIFNLKVINRAFPGVPKVFMYRNPLEVVIAAMRIPAQDIYFNEMFTGVSMKQFTEENTVLENACLVFKNICGEFIKNYNREDCLLINYSEFGDKDGVERLVKKVSNFFKIKGRSLNIKSIVSELTNYSKNRSMVFEQDTAEKISQANEKVREVVMLYLWDSYCQLELFRNEIH